MATANPIPSLPPPSVKMTSLIPMTLTAVLMSGPNMSFEQETEKNEHGRDDGSK